MMPDSNLDFYMYVCSDNDAGISLVYVLDILGIITLARTCIWVVRRRKNFVSLVRRSVNED